MVETLESISFLFSSFPTRTARSPHGIIKRAPYCLSARIRALTRAGPPPFSILPRSAATCFFPSLAAPATQASIPVAPLRYFVLRISEG